MRKSKIILGCIISVMAFALSLLIGLPNKVYASDVDDYINDNYSDLVFSDNLLPNSEFEGTFENTNFGIQNFNLPSGTYTVKVYGTIEIDKVFQLWFDVGGNSNGGQTWSMSSELTFTIDTPKTAFRIFTNGKIINPKIMLNKGSQALPYEPYITGSMIYNEAYNKALIDSMYWLNEYNTTLVDIVELNNNISYKDINNYTGTLNISYTTGLYGKADFRQLVSDFAYELANYEDIYEQFIEIELKFDSPIIFNKSTSTNFTTNDITGFTFYSSNGNEYNYDFSGTSEGAKDYVHNIVEGQNIYNVPFVKMKIRLIQTRYSTVPSPFISFVPDFYNLGYTEGYEIGNANGYNTGFNGGYDKGYNDGNIKGYNQGYNEGASSNIESNGIKTLFNSILSYPVNLISNVLDFEFMGVNIASLIMFIVSIGIVVFVVKKFW